MDATQLVLTWVGWKTCFDLRANLISTKVSASHRKSTQVHASPGQTESQVDPSFLLASVTPFGQGTNFLCCLCFLACYWRYHHNPPPCGTTCPLCRHLRQLCTVLWRDKTYKRCGLNTYSTRDQKSRKARSPWMS